MNDRFAPSNAVENLKLVGFLTFWLMVGTAVAAAAHSLVWTFVFGAATLFAFLWIFRRTVHLQYKVEGKLIGQTQTKETLVEA